MAWINILNCIPFFVLVAYVSWHGAADLSWENALILGSSLSCVVIGIQLYYNVIINRFFFSLYLSLITGAMLFLTKSYYVLYYYKTYSGTTILLTLALVAILTTFFTRSGFFEIELSDKRRVKKSLLHFLIVNVAAIVWSLVMNSYGMIISLLMPWALLHGLHRILRNKLVR